MSYLIYPSLQAPVLTEAQRPEAVTADRVLQPLSLPPSRLNARVAAGVAVALLASGQFMSPNDLPNTGQTVDMWGYAWSEPVRVPARLQAASNDHHGFVQAAPFTETVLPDKWFIPLSDPVRVPQRLVTGAQREATQDPTALTAAETVFIDKYLYPLAEPVRVPARLTTGAQQAFTIAPTALQLAEQVTESRWHQPWSEPRRYLDSIAQRRTLIAALQQVEPLNPFGTAFTESVYWFQPLSEPQRDLGARRNKLTLIAASQQASPLNPFGMTQPETVHINKFLIGLSEPVRIKRGLYARHHREFTIDPAAFIVPEPPSIDKFMFGLSEPMRLKPGLRKELQQTATIDPFALTLRRASAKAYVIV